MAEGFLYTFFFFEITELWSFVPTCYYIYFKYFKFLFVLLILIKFQKLAYHFIWIHFLYSTAMDHHVENKTSGKLKRIKGNERFVKALELTVSARFK